MYVYYPSTISSFYEINAIFRLSQESPASFCIRSTSSPRVPITQKSVYLRNPGDTKYFQTGETRCNRREEIAVAQQVYN